MKTRDRIKREPQAFKPSVKRRMTSGLLCELPIEKGKEQAEFLEKVKQEVKKIYYSSPPPKFLPTLIKRMANKGFFPPASWLVRDFKKWYELNALPEDNSSNLGFAELDLCHKYADECADRFKASNMCFF